MYTEAQLEMKNEILSQSPLLQVITNIAAIAQNPQKWVEDFLPYVGEIEDHLKNTASDNIYNLSVNACVVAGHSFEIFNPLVDFDETTRWSRVGIACGFEVGTIRNCELFVPDIELTLKNIYIFNSKLYKELPEYAPTTRFTRFMLRQGAIFASRHPKQIVQPPKLAGSVLDFLNSLEIDDI